ncbi:MAG: BTAD domain-containing putative transcriptional regulator [Burkholderiales bacterium]
MLRPAAGEAPRTRNAAERTRLFERMDQLRSHKLVWIAGPGGSGKSTLAASYAGSRGLPVLWIDLEGSDSDPGCFFAHVSACVSSRRQPLPRYAPEHAGNVLGFARRFFRHLFQQLPSSALIVLDNAETISEESSFALLLREALDLTPEGIQWCVISGEGVFSDLDYLAAIFKGSKIGPGELALSASEIPGLLPESLRGDHALCERIHGVSGGLIAVIKPLLMAAPWPENMFSGSIAGKAFYLACAQTLLGSLEESNRQMLMALALLERVTPETLHGLAPHPKVAGLLSTWARQGVYVHMREEDGHSYRFHALFRELLVQMTSTQWTAPQQRGLAFRVAQFCERTGRTNEALRLYQRAGEWGAVSGLIRREAEIEISKGRWTRLRAWIESVPDEVIEQIPALRYWLGRALLPSDPELARLCFRRAHSQFEHARDVAGQALCLAGTVWAVLGQETPAAGLAPLASALDECIERAEGFPSHSAELSVLSALQVAAMWSATAPGGLVQRASRVHELLNAFDLEATEKFAAAAHLLEYYDTIGEADLGGRLTEQIAKEPHAFASGSFAYCHWRVSVGRHEAMLGRNGDALNILDEATGVAQREGYRAMELLARYTRVPLLLRSGRLMDAQEDLHAMSGLTRPKEPAGLARYARCAALIAAEHGNFEEALKQSDAFVQPALDATPKFVFLQGAGEAVVWHAGHGSLKQAQLVLAQVEKRAQHYCYRPWRVLAALLHAYLVREDGAQCRQHLGNCLALLAEHPSWGHVLRPVAVPAATMMAHALNNAMDPVVPVRLIRDLALQAPSSTIPDWPWSIRIRTLGGFEMAFADTQESSPRAMTKAAFGLLAALVIAGPQGCVEKSLIEQLWPGQNAAEGRQSLRTALKALRRYMGGEDRVRQLGRTIALNPAQCWVDSWAFDELAAEDPARALGLYGGQFLSNDQGTAVREHREQLHERYLRTLSAHSQYHENHDRYDTALALYRAGLQIDPGCEAFYQGVMRCELQLGHPTEARRAYDLLTQALSAQPGVKPSQVSEKIFEKIRGGEISASGKATQA